ncbi:hypothetical protein ACFSKN_06585 [Mariniflexile gromovii]|uniref:Parallel beta helix pectate lyase-like protein n=1 Tax=Mariniflexile gromovii TaxID=362523 RepID=A0ABS4BQI0_9FLAO|nr:hypothetical protein [Mariniflexile gromovii]MBP0902668.1 hypothetical protein [Mariniflexile gromovii]
MKTNLIFMLLFSMLIIACDKDDTINEPSNTLEAKVESFNGLVYVGQLVTLNGSESKDNAGKPFQFLWKFKSKPATSASLLEDATTSKPKFTPDSEGVYVLELKIYNQVFSDTDEISITVNKNNIPNDGPIVLSDDINADYVLTNIYEDSNMPDYLVTKDIHVRGNLRIHPSVTIAFEENTAMYIENQGSIEVIGSANQFSYFTGKEKTIGYWKGLVINSNSSLNKLDRVIIEYAGSGIASGMQEAAAVSLNNEGAGNLKVVSSIFQYNKGFAIAAETGTKLTTESFTVFRNNQKLAMIPASQLLAINSLSDFQNNEINTIEVIGDRINASNNITWSPVQADIKYALKGKLEIASGLIMTEGSEFQMENDAEIIIMPTGYLTAIGTQQYPIKFYGKQQASQGYWKGIGFKSNNTKNELKHVEIIGAGSAPMDGFVLKTNIGVEGDNNAHLKISESLISKSGGIGLLIEKKATHNNLGFLRFKDNTASAIALPANEVEKLNNVAALEFSGNQHNGVEIFSSNLLVEQGRESIWPALGFSYTYLVSGNLSIDTGLKVLSGAIFKFEEDVTMRITTNGYLDAKGTNDQNIWFTGNNQTKGFWNGILIQSSSNKNVMEYCNVSYAGKSPMLNINKVTSIGLDGDSLGKLSIANSKISHGYGYGIAIEDNRAIINSNAESSNIFSDLDLGNIYKP